MKYISLSFDDSRSDTYDVAKPIMEKYGLTGTCNVITDFVLNPSHFSFVSAANSMTAEQVIEWVKWGGEIACHGSTHKNTPNDIIKNIDELKRIGVDIGTIGFASPESWLTVSNMESSGIKKLKDDGVVKYLRSGIQVRREGVWYTLISVVEMFTHSPYLYYLQNKRCVFKYKAENEFVLSAAVKDYTTVRQVKYLIETLVDSEALILMFHSVLEKGNEGYGTDHYYWDSNRFDELCNYLSESDDITVVNTCDLLSY